MPPVQDRASVSSPLPLLGPLPYLDAVLGIHPRAAVELWASHISWVLGGSCHLPSPGADQKKKNETRRILPGLEAGHGSWLQRSPDSGFPVASNKYNRHFTLWPGFCLLAVWCVETLH